MELRKMHWLGIIASVVILIIDFVFFLDNDRLLYFLAGIAVTIAALPFVIGISIEGRKEQEMNGMFLEFTRNLRKVLRREHP
jgi:hypothetical protein